IIVCHHKVSTYFGGHLMHQSTQKQKVQGNSRLQLMAIDRRPRTRWQISAMRLGPDARQKIVSPLNNQA
ncbi:hypothetical protein, partial [Bradyrhizobium sp. 174]|uniref:hypothetical protein n=1 Tax=Bradyrhizobium sp. 174 TaxID=2782645 RepID=UPI001FFAA701